MTPIELTEIPLDYPAREALEVALGKSAGTALYKQIVERVGKEPGKNLGHGMKGVVYYLGNGRVLKLTADASEIEAMTLMKGSRHPNLIRVEDAFVVCRGLSGVGVVIREWVGDVLEGSGVSRGFLESLQMAVDHASDSMDDSEAEGHPYEDSLLTGMEDLLVYLEDVGRGGTPREERIAKGIRAGVQELYNLGIYGIDFHAKNIAVDDDGNAVIFDVGVVNVSPRKSFKVSTIGCTPGRKIVSFDSPC